MDLSTFPRGDTANNIGAIRDGVFSVGCGLNDGQPTR
jgi:hypothetical protein